jgi:hypothetical protein
VQVPIARHNAAVPKFPRSWAGIPSCLNKSWEPSGEPLPTDMQRHEAWPSVRYITLSSCLAMVNHTGR